MPSLNRLPRLALALAAAGALAGCQALNDQKPGGRMASLDQHTYESTAHSPKTVRLIDTRTLEELWSMDVPVGHKVVVRFYPDKTDGNVQFPDVMRWDLVKAGNANRGFLDNQMPVPPAYARRLELRIRSGPEYIPEGPAATDIMPGGGPVAPAPAGEG